MIKAVKYIFLYVVGSHWFFFVWKQKTEQGYAVGKFVCVLTVRIFFFQTQFFAWAMGILYTV